MVGRIDRMAEGEGVGSYDKNATALDPRRARGHGRGSSIIDSCGCKRVDGCSIELDKNRLSKCLRKIILLH